MHLIKIILVNTASGDHWGARKAYISEIAIRFWHCRKFNVNWISRVLARFDSAGMGWFL